MSVLPTLRASAERLGGAISGILAGAGVAALLAGPTNFEKLTGAPAVVAECVFLFGVVCGLLASLVALRAAQPQLIRSILAPDVADRFNAKEVRTTRGCLAAARLLAAGSLAAVLLSASLLWLSPTTKEDDRFTGRLRSGEIVCGKLAGGAGDAVLESKSRRFLVVDLAELRAAPACPSD